jgi:hypothetical protein
MLYPAIAALFSGILDTGRLIGTNLMRRSEMLAKPTLVLPRIVKKRCPAAGQRMTLIEGSQRQKPGVAGDPAAGKVNVGRPMTVEGKVSGGTTLVSSDGRFERECWVGKPSVHEPLSVSFLTWPAKSMKNPG